jgi:hypothetical protein
MGSESTIDNYCGADPTRNITHDVNNKSLHFPGCGYHKEQCTKRPCCDDALKYKFNSTTCTDAPGDYMFYDPRTRTAKPKRISCLDHFKECFLDNMRTVGQCCECNKGWTG